MRAMNLSRGRLRGRQKVVQALCYYSFVGQQWSLSKNIQLSFLYTILMQGINLHEDQDCPQHSQLLTYICNYLTCPDPHPLLCNHKACLQRHNHANNISLTSLSSLRNDYTRNCATIEQRFQLAQDKVMAYYDELAEQMLKIIELEKDESLAILSVLKAENAALNEGSICELMNFVRQQSNIQKQEFLGFKGALHNFESTPSFIKIRQFLDEIEQRSSLQQQLFEQLKSKHCFHKIFKIKSGKFLEQTRVYRSPSQGQVWHHYHAKTDAIGFVPDHDSLLLGFIQCEIESWPKDQKVLLQINVYKEHSLIYTEKFVLQEAVHSGTPIDLLYQFYVPVKKKKLYEITLTNQGDYFKTKRASNCKSRAQGFQFLRSEFENNGKNQYSGQIHGLIIEKP